MKRKPSKENATKKKGNRKSENADFDEPEGLDVDHELGEFPIDTLLIRNEQRTVFDILRRIEQGGYILNPDFQRPALWELERQSKLIESVVMRIPLPVFYFAENHDGDIIVVDGVQRLTTFRNYLNNDFQLKLEKNPFLDGKYFKDLPAKLQNRIEDSNLVVYILDANVPDHARLEIFERVNSGVPLTRQQMRNSLYNGPATKWLGKEAATELFLTATGESLDPKKMRDRELINRFCAFHLFGYEHYEKSDMDGFLAEALVRMNRMEECEFVDLTRAFRRGLSNNLVLFEKHAFRKHTPGRRSRSIINASLWDVMVTGLARYDNEIIEEHSKELKEAYYDLLEDEEFSYAITYGPNSTKRVGERFRLAQKMLKDVLDD